MVRLVNTENIVFGCYHACQVDGLRRVPKLCRYFQNHDFSIDQNSPEIGPGFIYHHFIVPNAEQNPL